MVVPIATSINVGAEISLSGDGEISAPKKLIKTNTIFLIIYSHHSSSPRQRLRRCRGRGVLRVPAAGAGGKVGGFRVNDCMYVI